MGDEEEVLIELIGENQWKIHGSALLEDVSKAVGVALSDDECDTFNGLIFHVLETVPEDGTDIELEIVGLHIKVTEIEEHQVETAIVEKIEVAS